MRRAIVIPIVFGLLFTLLTGCDTRGRRELQENSYEEGYKVGHREGYKEGYANGYTDGFADGIDE